MSYILGIQNGPLGLKPIEEQFKAAKELGASTMELYSQSNSGVWKNREKIKGLISETSVAVGALFSSGSLVGCGGGAEDEREHAKAVIEFCQALGIPLMTCNMGYDADVKGDWRADITAFYRQMDAVDETFLPLGDFARDHSVKISIENCPHGGKNLWSTPRAIMEICEGLLEDNTPIGFEFDPSHLVWQFVDYYGFAEKMAKMGRIYSIHAKDIMVWKEKLGMYGFYQNPEQWWRFTIPGKGQIDWKKFFDATKPALSAGDIPVFVEHEDGQYGGDKVMEGFRISLDTLKRAVG
ncbi:MAG: sugar phosphate isomerase/epimerase family protein [Promethearchaeota archaeon]